VEVLQVELLPQFELLTHWTQFPEEHQVFVGSGQ
jgi:hypothetical protein